MTLRESAQAEARLIMNDKENAFGFDITLTDPAGASLDLVGRSQDIAQVIDPDTGQAVSGRLASASFCIADIIDGGLGLPVGIADDAATPWVVEFNDINGSSYVFKVSESNPDRTLGLIVCLLEVYEK